MTSTTRLSCIAAFAALTCAAGGANAAWDGSAAYQACIKAADGNDPGMAACATAEFARADKTLNTDYQELLKRVGGAQKDAIRRSQQTWIAYRDSTCDAEAAAYDGGTFQSVARNECLARLTDDRALWLRGIGL